VNEKILKQVNELKEKTKDLTPTKFASLTKDPCKNGKNIASHTNFFSYFVHAIKMFFLDNDD